MAILGAIFLILIALILTPIVRGFVLSILWMWFLVPFGLPAIGVAWAIGISMIASMITYQDVTSPEREIPEAFGMSLGGPLVLLLIGWVVQMFM